MDELLKLLRGLGKEKTFEEKKAKSKLIPPLFEGETPTEIKAKEVPSVIPQEPPKRSITIDTDQGKEEMSDEVNNLLFRLEKYGMATPSAESQKHPMMDTSLPGEKTNWNIGENPTFDLNPPDTPNDDGSWDRGFRRINSYTFEDMLSGKGRDPQGNVIEMPYWKDRANALGIYDWEDMKDPVLNVDMSGLIIERENYNKDTGPLHAWYATPIKHRLP